MRNLLVDLLAGILITISAVYDFGVPECYVFIAFSVLLIIAEIYTIIKNKHGDKKDALTYRSKAADWYDLFLGIILIVSYAEWLGFKTLWFYIVALLSLFISMNAVYNLLQRRKYTGEEVQQKEGSNSWQDWLKTLIDI